MRYLVESGVDVTGDVGDLLLETAAPLMQALGVKEKVASVWWFGTWFFFQIYWK